MRWIFRILMVLSAVSPALAAACGRKSLRIKIVCPQAHLIVAIGVLGTLLSPVFGAHYDLPILRGSEAVPALPVGPPRIQTRWSGFYFGGALSYSNGTADFSRATQPLLAFSLRSTTIEEQVQPSSIPLLGKGASNALGGGAFLGYNTQWQDVIIGFEGTYAHTNLSTTASASAVARTFPTVTDAVALSASGRLNLTDYGEARFRAGYVVGNFLPYGFVGLAVGGKLRCPLWRMLHKPRIQQILTIPAWRMVYRQRRASFFPFPTAPDKTTRCFGAIPSASDSIGH